MAHGGKPKTSEREIAGAAAARKARARPRDACDVSKRDADVSETAGARGAGKRQEIGIKIILGVPSVIFEKSEKDKLEQSNIKFCSATYGMQH